jgi:glycosyltransferase involved in cell wall biosynthesis
MRILVLSQWYQPEPEFKIANLSRGLAERGHEVMVVTGFPNYPSGKIYPGYRIRWQSKQIEDGVAIHRVPLYPSRSSSVIGRALNYSSFGLSACISTVVMRYRPEVAYVYHPPLTVGIAARVMRTLRGVPYLYDIQDLWPDTLPATGMATNRALLRGVSAACDWVYRGASRIAVLSPGFRRALVSRGVDPGKIEVIPNWCDEASLDLPGIGAAGLAREGRVTILFAGNMGPAQGLDAVLDAAKVAGSRGIPVDVVFLGDGIESPRLRIRSRELGLSNVRFLPRVPPSQVGGYLRAADALLVSLTDDPLFAMTIPSKTQAYMYIGRPIVMAVRGDAADLVARSGCGICCNPGDSASITDAFAQLAALAPAERASMGASGAAYYRSHLSMQSGVARIERALLEASACRGR